MDLIRLLTRPAPVDAIPDERVAAEVVVPFVPFIPPPAVNVLPVPPVFVVGEQVTPFPVIFS